MFEATGMVIIANILPTIEQLGAIPLGLALGLNPISVFIISVIVNCLLFFPVYFGLNLFYYSLLRKIKLFNKYLERVRYKGKPYVDKYGFIGLTIFIALPSPLTGTYTATILSWLLGLEWKRSFLVIALGSAIGGIIVLLGSLGFLGFMKGFVKL